MIKLSVLSLMCVTAPLFAQGGEQTLRTTAKKGSSIWLLQEQKSEQTIEQGGQQYEVVTTINHTLHVSVLEIDDKGVMNVETEIARIHGSMQGPMGDADFDSAAPAEEDEDGSPFSPSAMTKTITKAAGKKFVAKVDGRGKALTLEGAEELLKSGGSARMGGVTESTLKQMVESAFGMMPEKPVAVGGSWDHEQKENGGMPTQKVKLTLAKADDASFEITAAGTIEKPEAKEGADDNPMKSMNMQNGKVTGTQRISRQDGFIIDATHLMSMDLEMDTPGGAASIAVKQTTTTKRTTAEAAMPKKVEKDKPAPAKEEPKEEKKEKAGGE